MIEPSVILISCLCAVAVSSICMCVIAVIALRGHRKDVAEWRQLVENSFIHIKSGTAPEAVNAVSAMEYNRKVIDEEPEEEEPPPPSMPPILRDRASGREYDVIGGTFDEFIPGFGPKRDV